jgi:hypothetical protein
MYNRKSPGNLNIIKILQKLLHYKMTININIKGNYV